MILLISAFWVARCLAVLLYFWSNVSVCNPGWPWTCNPLSARSSGVCCYSPLSSWTSFQHPFTGSLAIWISLSKYPLHIFKLGYLFSSWIGQVSLPDTWLENTVGAPCPWTPYPQIVKLEYGFYLFIYLLTYLLIFVVLGFELGASCLLGMLSTSWAPSPAQEIFF
jgi:hypothetical protein